MPPEICGKYTKWYKNEHFLSPFDAYPKKRERISDTPRMFSNLAAGRGETAGMGLGWGRLTLIMKLHIINSKYYG